MCTLTIIPLSIAGQRGFRLVTNRDESRRRPAAEPPAERSAPADGSPALWPLDPQGGGTWIAASRAGLVLSLLNSAQPDGVEAPPARLLTSRGLVIPSLIHHASAADAVDALSALELSAFAPFRLIACDGREIIEARWDLRALGVERAPLRAVCFVSSGLGDQLVAPRLALFRDWFAERAPTPDAQDAFHRHVWPDRPEISVLMSRADARTVSTTAVEATGAGAGARVVMTYSDGERRVVAGVGRRSSARAVAGERVRC